MRQSTQEGFLRDDIQVVVATVAFGMGIDKPRDEQELLVIHGVGEHKLERYGDEFLNLITTYCL